MKIFNESPVTDHSEQATAYVAASESEKKIVTNHLKTEDVMNEKNINAVKEETAEEMVDTEKSNNRTTDMNGQLSEDIIKLCKKAEKEIVNVLESDGLAGTILEKNIINLTGAINTGKIKVARLKMNRKPKAKAIKALKESMKQFGQQIMLLIIPAKVAMVLGFEIEGFNGEAISEEELYMTVVIIDGQTRMQGYLEAIKDEPDSPIGELYAYFPLNWIALSEMLTSINLKVFTWKNSDFMTGVLSNRNIEDEEKVALEYIKELESEGYSYTAACEWVILEKGIIRKTPLVKAMSSSNSSLEFTKAEFGILICKAAKNKFSGKNESAIKHKTIPELIIDKWNMACKELSQKEATEFMIDFIGRIDYETLTELVSPSGYVRGKDKKKEEFIKKTFNNTFQEYQKSHPYSIFKRNDKSE